MKQTIIHPLPVYYFLDEHQPIGWKRGSVQSSGRVWGGYLPSVEFEILWEKCANDLVGIQRNRERIHSCSVDCRNGLLNSEWIRDFIVWWKWSAGMDLLCWTATFDFSQEEEERGRRIPRIMFQVANIVAVLLACFKGVWQQFKA